MSLVMLERARPANSRPGALENAPDIVVSERTK
jgi:hypothetical protein